MADNGNDPVRADNGRSPTFFRQGVVILAPVLLLAVLGVLSLRQDAAFARHEARERARALADVMAEDLWRALTAPAGPAPTRLSFQVDLEGRLLSPTSFDRLPVPQPLNPGELAPGQERAWERLPTSSPEVADFHEARRAFGSFLELSPPDRFAAAAQYRLGLLLAHRGDIAAARDAFHAVATKFPGVVSESAVFYEPLARLKIAELPRNDPSGRDWSSEELEALCAAAVRWPSILTASLLDRAAALETNLGLAGVVRPWRLRWEEEEFARGLFESSRTHLFTGSNLTAGVTSTVFQFTADQRTVPGRRFVRVAHFPGPRGSNRVELPAPAPGAAGDTLPDAPDWLAIRTAQNTNGATFACYPSDPFASSGWPWQENPKMTVVWGIPEFEAKGTQMNSSLPDPRLASPLAEEWSRLQRRLPRYFGASLSVAGRTVVHPNVLPRLALAGGGKATGPGWTLLAPGAVSGTPELLAESTRAEDGLECLRVGIHLTGAQWLYEKGRSRTRLFGLLIAASAAVAVVGFLSARRAFQRQQRLAEMQSNFVSSVSHELRAPIASVRLMAEGLERGRIPEPQKQQEYFRFIGQECRRLSAMIENVLDFARIGQGRRPYDFEPTNVRRLVEETVKLMEPNATERQVKLVVILPNPETSAEGWQPSLDGPAIQQALVNLIDNALKHSPPGSEVVVELEAGSRPYAGAESGTGANDARAARSTNAKPGLRLSVSDHGPGIPPAERERIFERFHRLGSELRRETQGVGIGLSIVKHIVEAYGGRVWVEGEMGMGSRFVIELPASPPVGES